jgi:2-hydroxychromene-2-carboxylate isomerase
MPQEDARVTTPILKVYYDYVSPFAYMASVLLVALAKRHGCALDWKPIDLHQLSNFASGMPYSPSKRAYVGVDALRQSQFHGIPIAMPAPFPVQSGKALRLALVAKDEGAFEWFHSDVFRAAWAQSRDIGADEVLSEIIDRGGGQARSWLEKAGAAAIEERLSANIAEAEARGVFGVPTSVFNDELFWGIDSLPVLEWRLKTAKG